MSDLQVPTDDGCVANRVRNPTIDGLKYVAAAGIVLHHMAASTGTDLGYALSSGAVWALFFFSVSGYFHGEIGGRRSAWVRKRVTRLLVPYAVWSLLYLSWGLVQCAANGVQPSLPPAVDIVFFAGLSGTLWSLVLLAGLAVVVDYLVRTTAQRRIAIVLAALVTFAIYLKIDLSVVAANRYNYVLASRYLLAYLLGMEIRAAGSRGRVPLWTIQTVAFAFMFVSGVVRVYPRDLGAPMQLIIQTTLWVAAASLVLVAAARGASLFGVRHLGWAGDYLLGVYVVNMFWHITYLQRVPLAWMPDWAWIAVGSTFVLGMSTAVVAILRANRFTRILVT